MRIESILISDIEVTERRREDFGDLDGLAASINRLGLFQPIVVKVLPDDKYRLAAGERRLRAFQLLDRSEIPARMYDDLSEDERLEIELEENLQRKDLTEYEESKELIKKAREIAPFISSSLDEKREKPKDKRGRKTDLGAPKRDLAQALSTSEGNLVTAKQHIEVIEQHPELKPLPRRKAIAEAKKIDKPKSQPVRSFAKTPRPKTQGEKWRERLGEVRNFFSDAGDGSELVGAWSEREVKDFLADLYDVKEFNDRLISDIEYLVKDRQQAVAS